MNGVCTVKGIMQDDRSLMGIIIPLASTISRFEDVDIYSSNTIVKDAF